MDLILSGTFRHFRELLCSLFIPLLIIGSIIMDSGYSLAQDRNPIGPTKLDRIATLEKQLREAKANYEKQKGYLDTWERTLKNKVNDRGFLTGGMYQFVRAKGYFGGSRMLDFSDPYVRRAVEYGIGGSPSLMRLYSGSIGANHLTKEINIYKDTVRMQRIDTGLAAQKVRKLEDELSKLKNEQAKLEKACSSITSAWETDWGRMNLTQSGEKVTGSYTHDKGKIQGVIKNGVFTGRWSEAPSYAPPDDGGRVSLKFSSDCSSFSGTWGYGDDINEGVWHGNRISQN